MKTVYFVRHGEGENNARTKKEYLGYTAALTERGHSQARMIAERASKLSFDVLVSSPWRRTKETAEGIAKLTGHPIEYSELFYERRCPESFIGRTFDDPETQRMHKEWLAVFRAGEGRYLDGENFEDMKQRAADAWRFLTERAEESMLVVTHGVFLRMLYAYAVLGEALTASLYFEIEETMRTDNTGLTIFQYNSEDHESPDLRWRLRVWNDHAHLG